MQMMSAGYVVGYNFYSNLKDTVLPAIHEAKIFNTKTIKNLPTKSTNYHPFRHLWALGRCSLPIDWRGPLKPLA